MNPIKSKILGTTATIAMSITLCTTANAQDSVIYATVGDFGNASAGASNVASLIDSFNPDFVLALGDIRYGSRTFDETTGQFYCTYLTDVLTGSNCSGGDSPTNRFFAAPGNHEHTDGGGINEYLDYFTLPGAGITTTNNSNSERYYDAVVGPVHIFTLDSQSITNNGGPNSPDALAQKAWLQEQLAASTSIWKVVVVHHPPYSSSSAHGSDADMQLPYAAWGADVVFAGHDHTYERLTRDGIPYFVNGSGGRGFYNFGAPIAGSQFRYNAEFGAMIVEANQTSMDFKFFNVSNELVDDYTISNTPATNVPPTAAFASRCTFSNELCPFKGTASTDSDGNIVSYGWDFGDGGTGTGQSISHTYSAAGTYGVSLTVTDDDGDIDTVTENITVIAPQISENTIDLSKTRRGDKIGITWTGVKTKKADIYKNGTLYKRTRDDGKYMDKNVSVGETYTYKVCDKNSATACSPEAKIGF